MGTLWWTHRKVSEVQLCMGVASFQERVPNVDVAVQLRGEVRSRDCGGRV